MLPLLLSIGIVLGIVAQVESPLQYVLEFANDVLAESYRIAKSESVLIWVMLSFLRLIVYLVLLCRVGP